MDTAKSIRDLKAKINQPVCIHTWTDWFEGKVICSNSPHRYPSDVKYLEELLAMIGVSIISGLAYR